MTDFCAEFAEIFSRSYAYAREQPWSQFRNASTIVVRTKYPNLNELKLIIRRAKLVRLHSWAPSFTTTNN